MGTSEKIQFPEASLSHDKVNKKRNYGKVRYSMSRGTKSVLPFNCE